MSINTNFPVRHIYERLQADSTKAQIARLHGAPQKIKKFFILALAKYIAMFLDFLMILMIILQASSSGSCPEGGVRAGSLRGEAWMVCWS